MQPHSLTYTGEMLNGQTRIIEFKSAYNSLIVGPRGGQCETNL